MLSLCLLPVVLSPKASLHVLQSALCWMYGRRIYEAFPTVPIGLIEADVGGTAIEPVSCSNGRLGLTVAAALTVADLLPNRSTATCSSARTVAWRR